jgi:predicted O-linked N-acetylglucosamine transferase (SPINDLY family)
MNAGNRKSVADETFLRGLAFDRQGQAARAAACYVDALRHDPGHADSLHLLGVYRAQRGELDAAVRLITEAIRRNPRFPDYRYNLAKVLELAGSNAEAEQEYREVLKLNPAHVDALINLSHLSLGKPAPEAAIQYAQRALELQPRSVGAHNNLALALNSLDRSEEAESILLRALEIRPDSADTLVNLSRVYRRMERYQEAIACLRRAVALAPDLPEALNNLGSALKFEGKLDEALACIRKALAIAPNAAVHSNLLFNLNYHPGHSAEAVFREHLAWAERYANGLTRAAAPPVPDKDRSRRLRVGYVSADFRQHPVATFLRPILANHDKDRFEIFCYADVARADDTTRWFAQQCGVWRDIVGKTDAQVAEAIRRDRIDILVDLAGHTSGNRLLVFARKPAPLQLSYLGYLGTTGMAAMDYKITDAAMDPEGLTECFHTERLLRLPHSMWCYAPPEQAPEPAATPAARRGHVTFASFNNSAKVTPEVVATWGRILRALPEARLVMVTKGDGSVHDYFRGQFADNGIDPARVDLRRRMPLAEYLQLHAEVDIALDTFPYTGGTTSCHSLWMGVPVITLPGDKPFSRSGASILHALELDDWVAGTLDEYVDVAVRKASDIPALQELRGELRTRMQRSPLTNGKEFAGAIEDLYRGIWSEFVGAPGSAPEVGS